MEYIKCSDEQPQPEPPKDEYCKRDLSKTHCTYPECECTKDGLKDEL